VVAACWFGGVIRSIDPCVDVAEGVSGYVG